MINVIVILTNGRNVAITSNSLNWSDIKSQLQSQHSVDFQNVSVKLVRANGIQQGGASNLTLEDNSVLPSGASSYVIALTQAKMKGALELEYSLEDVADMTYRELIATIKLLKMEALDENNDDVLEIIGNYSHATVEGLRNILRSIYNYVASENDSDDSQVGGAIVDNLQRQITDLQQRITDIETHLLIPTKEVLQRNLA